MLLAPLVLLVSAGAASAACGAPVDVQVDQDACAGTLAVSVAGDAYGEQCRGPVSCVAVSGVGNAENNDYQTSPYGNFNGCGDTYNAAVGCIAVSGTGSATNNAGSAGACGNSPAVVPVLLSPRFFNTYYPAAGCIAVSGTGDATNNINGGYSCGYASNSVGCIAVSGMGDATNNVAGKGYGQACGSKQSGDLVNVGCLAVSGTGDAVNNAGHYSCGQAMSYSAGVSVGCLAVSGGGDARNHANGQYGGVGSCGNNQGPTVALGCVAISGLGEASNSGSSFDPYGSPCGGGWEAEDAGGIGVGCIAIGGGSASNQVDGEECEMYAGSFGNSEAIRCIALSPSSLPSPAAGPLAPLVPSTHHGWAFDRFAQAEVLLVDTASAPVSAAPWWDGWFGAFQAWLSATFGGWF